MFGTINRWSDLKKSARKPNGKKTIAIANPTITLGNAIKMELEAFVNAINLGIEPPVTILDGFRAMDVAHQILEKINHQEFS